MPLPTANFPAEQLVQARLFASQEHPMQSFHQDLYQTIDAEFLIQQFHSSQGETGTPRNCLDALRKRNACHTLRTPMPKEPAHSLASARGMSAQNNNVEFRW